MQSRDDRSRLQLLADALIAGAGALLALGLVALCHEGLYGDQDLPLIIGAFGASAVVLFGAPDSPLSRPRNVFGGSLLASLIGVCLNQLWPDGPDWALILLAVPLSIVVMELTDTMHPPAGAMAFIAVAGPREVQEMGFLYLVYPVGTGVTVMMLTAWLVQWLRPGRPGG